MMLFYAGDAVLSFKLGNLLEQYGTPFYGLDCITLQLYAMYTNSMTLSQEQVSVLPAVKPLAGSYK